MNRRNLLLAALCAAAVPIAGHAASLRAISDYLNTLRAVRTTFSQFSADGRMSRGVITLRRPGRARFEYTMPEETLILVESGTIAVFDAKSNQPPQVYPLDRTPLNLILAADVDLTRATMVDGPFQDGDRTIVVARDPQQTEDGWIELIFANDPIMLLGWTIVSAAGERTDVALDLLETLQSQPPASDFSIDAEATRRKGIVQR